MSKANEKPSKKRPAKATVSYTLEIVPAEKGKAHGVHALRDGEVIITRQGNLGDRGALVKVATALTDDLSDKGIEAGAEDVTAELEGLWLAYVNAKRERARKLEEMALKAAEAAANAPDPPDPADIDARAAALLAEMPEDIQREGEKYLRAPDLIDRITVDAAALGIAGEEDLTLLLYLTGTGRLLRQPVSLHVKGPTASGKSYVIDRVADLFPPEAVLRATEISPKALYYGDPHMLRHRWIVAGERSRQDEDGDKAEAYRALREMITAGKLAKLVTTRDAEGRLTSEMVQRDGPIAFTESTTLEELFEEDENRCLSAYTNETPEQSRRVVARVAEIEAGAAGATDTARVVQRHRAIQRTLRRRDVVIPFAPALGANFKTARVESRRAFPHLCAVIKLSALLHQFQRKADAEGRLIATRADYDLAARLVSGSLARLLADRVPDGAVRFQARVKEWFKREHFTLTEVRARETGSRSSVHAWLRSLQAVGAAEIVQGSRGPQAAVWKLTDVEPSKTADVLPAADEIFTDPPSTRPNGRRISRCWSRLSSICWSWLPG
jgi:hypothetical protein